MSSIDNRIVNLKIENGDLQSGAKTSLDILARLKEALRFDGAGKGLSDVQGAVNKTDFGPMATSIEKVNAGFAAMATVAITALSNITTKAIDTGTQLANSLFVQPKTEGLAEYELKLGSIQTIMASTGEELPVVNKYLEELNAYSDKTIYSFSDMTENIGKFTNAGVGLEDSVLALQGVANVAAISGANANEASRSMYNFSQALSIGHVGLMDWKSIELANMGTAEFRKELIASAEAMGTLKKQSDGTWKTLEGTTVTVDNFRNTLNDQWLTSEALVETLGRYADETSDVGGRATEAATQVKTLSHLLDTLQEGQASGWAMTWENIIGDYDEARALFTGLNEVVGGFLGRQADARNKMLADWKAAGGRDDLIQGFKNIFQALVNIIKPINDAFRNIFPPTTGKQLASYTEAFRKFTELLKMAAPIGQVLGNVFKVIFATLKVGIDIVKGIASVFITLISSVFKAISGGEGSGVIEFFVNLSDKVGAAAVAFSKGDYIINFFERVNAVVVAVVPFIVKALGYFGEAVKLFFQGDREGATSALEKALEQLSKVANKVLEALGPVGDILRDFFGKISAGAKSLKTFLDGLGIAALKPFVAALEWLSETFDTVQKKLGEGFKFGKKGAGAVGAEIDILRGRLETFVKWLGDAWDSAVEVFQGVKDALAPILKWIGDQVSNVGDMVSNTFKGKDLQDAASLLNTGIFAALGVVIYKFFKSLSDIVDDFKEIGRNIVDVLEGLTNQLKVMQTDIKANIILKIAIAVGILAGSLYLLSRIEGNDMWRGLAGVGILLAGMTAVLFAVTKMDFSNTGKSVLAATSMVILAGAIFLLAQSVKSLSGMSWDELAKGLTGVAGLLIALGLFSRIAQASSGSIGGAITLVALAGAIGLLGFAVQKFGEMDRGTLQQGLITVGILMGAVAVLMNSFRGLKGAVGGATAMLIVSAAMLALYGVIKLYNGMDYETFAKGGGMIAGAVLAIGGAMRAFPEKSAIAGAAAMIVVSAAMWVVSGVLDKFAEYDGGDIAASMGMLAGVLILIAGAMIVLSAPNVMTGALALGVVVLALWALSGVLAVFATFDIGDIAAALGMLAGVFVVIGLAGVIMAPIVPVILALGIAIGLLGVAMLAAGAGMALFGIGFAALATTGVAGIAVLIAAFEGIIALIPIFMEQVGLGMIAFANVISESGPEIIAALSTILDSLLQAVSDNVPKMLDVAGDLILAFLDKVVELTPQITQAGLDLILSFLGKIEENIGNIVNIVADLIVEFTDAIADRLDDISESALNLFEEFLDTLLENSERMQDAAFDFIIEFLIGITRQIVTLTRRAREVAVDFLNAMADELEDSAYLVTSAAFRVGLAIPKGIARGVSQSIGAQGMVIAQAIVPGIMGPVRSLLGINSPSRLFADVVGSAIPEGVAKGVLDNMQYATSAATTMGKETLRSTQDALNNAMANLKMDMDLTPTIVPVVDLTEAKRGFGRMNSLIPDLEFAAKVSASGANFISDSRERDREEASVTNIQNVENKEFSYTQNIHSPKAVPAEEVYRNTNNQLSRIKKEL